MEQVSKPKIQQSIPIVMLITFFTLSPVKAQSQDGRPVADAGLSRYVAVDPVQLDGTGSYDLDSSGPLTYMWQQIAGPSVVINDADTNKPTISGFVQTDEIQECELELIVSDGQHKSLPDTVVVNIVPFFSGVEMLLENDLFDPNKPTIIYFGGGDGVNGLPGYAQPPWDFSVWSPRANLLSFPDGYKADLGTGASPTYHSLGNAIISFLSSIAPNYNRPIQTIGWSTGGLPAVKVATYLNQTYQDARYAVNRVTGLDAVGPGASEMINEYLDSAVDGEQCWLDSYVSTSSSFYSSILNVGFEVSQHSLPRDWYGQSLTANAPSDFNSGVVGGAYWSVIGSGKNLQLASTPGKKAYILKWYGSATSGYMDLYNESSYPGKLPEPVTLVGPADGAIVDANGALLSCEESENAVGYQLLFGPDPYRVMDYLVVSDTPSPPVETISEFPFEETWWTVRVYDSFGSTIHADPRCINATIVSPQMMLPHVLYIHESDIEAAKSFQSLLVNYGCSVTLIGLADVTTTPLDSYDLIIVGNDTGRLRLWGDVESVTTIGGSGKPISGLGEGGYAFFGKLELSIGWPNGWHGDNNNIYVVDTNCPLFDMPYPISVPDNRMLQLYTQTDHVGIYLPFVPKNILALGGETPYPTHYPLVLQQDRYLLWGFTESPLKMTEDGKQLFVNIVIRTANKAWGS